MRNFNKLSLLLVLCFNLFAQVPDSLSINIENSKIDSLENQIENYKHTLLNDNIVSKVMRLRYDSLSLSDQFAYIKMLCEKKSVKYCLNKFCLFLQIAEARLEQLAEVYDNSDISERTTISLHIKKTRNIVAQVRLQIDRLKPEVKDTITKNEPLKLDVEY